MESNGVVGASEPGKMRAILLERIKKKDSAKLRLLVIFDSLHQPTPMDADLVMRIENFWKIEQGEVNRVECDLARIRKPDSQLKKWLETSEPDCLLFDTIPRHWVKSVEELGIPCYAMGGSVGQSNGVLSGSGFRLAQHVEKVLHDLLELEHQRILIVMGRATDEEMKNEIHEETAQILAQHQREKEISLSAMIPDLINPSDWANWWKEALLKECPSVVITDSVYLALSLHNFCLARKIQMPRDLSMVVLDDAEFLTWLAPLPTRYRYKNDQAFRHFRSWVRGGFVPGTTKFFTRNFVEGQTLGRVGEG